MNTSSYAFGAFVLIPHRQVLLRGHLPVRLGSRALDLLTQLVQRAGEVIDKRTLLANAWPDTFVDESNLKVHIAAIRRVLDAGGGQSCIATVIGRGYRFVEEVRSTHFTTAEDLRPDIAILQNSDAPRDSFTQQSSGLTKRELAAMQQQLLSLIDSDEDQIEDVARFAQGLLAACCQVRLIAASRGASRAALNEMVLSSRALQ